MEKKKYRVPMTGRVDTEIEVYATNKQEAITVAYEESEKDDFCPSINFYRDTYEEDVEEVDELREDMNDAIHSVLLIWAKTHGDELMETDSGEFNRRWKELGKKTQEFIEELANQEVKEVS